MTKTKSMTFLAAFAALSLSAPLAAQTRSTVNAATLNAAVSARPERASRAAVTSALTSSRALEIAATMGLSSDAVSARIGALDEVGTARIAEEVLAGGDSTIVISTTAIIIGLLLLILLTR
ncbi:MAG TPA: hypothetical protein VE861_13860 [Gemmatimonadaceae bacterium]|nr:hypothetical protein [Gemmatimonadaceae bacterium]